MDELKKLFEKFWDENINDNGFDAVWDWWFEKLKDRERAVRQKMIEGGDNVSYNLGFSAALGCQLDAHGRVKYSEEQLQAVREETLKQCLDICWDNKNVLTVVDAGLEIQKLLSNDNQTKENP